MTVGTKENRTIRNQKPIALRLASPEIEDELYELSKQQGLSLNMTVNMLLGYAFNEVKRQNKVFESKILFESK